MLLAALHFSAPTPNQQPGRYFHVVSAKADVGVPQNHTYLVSRCRAPRLSEGLKAWLDASSADKVAHVGAKDAKEPDVIAVCYWIPVPALCSSLLNMIALSPFRMQLPGPRRVFESFSCQLPWPNADHANGYKRVSHI